MSNSSLAVIYMGGTFGCVGEPLSPMPAQQFLQCLSRFYPDLNFFSAPVIKDSSELSAQDWLNLAHFIESLAKQHQYQQFIILHGTDTLAYASAFLYHLFAQRYTIILTGSQFPLLKVDGSALRPQSDAQANFEFAVANMAKTQNGVFLAFNQQLFYGNSTYKAHTHHENAFTGQAVTAQHYPSTSLNAFAQLHLDETSLSHYVQKFATLSIVNWYVQPCLSTQLAEQLQHFSHQPPNILILQGFGSGNLAYSDALYHCLKALNTQGCQIIISSQVFFGELSQQYATGHWLKDVGVVFDTHISQADSYARLVLLNLMYADTWQEFWTINDE